MNDILEICDDKTVESIRKDPDSLCDTLIIKFVDGTTLTIKSPDKLADLEVTLS